MGVSVIVVIFLMGLAVNFMIDSGIASHNADAINRYNVESELVLSHFKKMGVGENDIGCVKKLQENGSVEDDIAAAIMKYKVSCDIIYNKNK